MDYLMTIKDEFPGYTTSGPRSSSRTRAWTPDPDTGYRYGSAWLKEFPPQSVIDFLTSLPDTEPAPLRGSDTDKGSTTCAKPQYRGPGPPKQAGALCDRGWSRDTTPDLPCRQDLQALPAGLR